MLSPQEISKRYKLQSLGMPKASPSSSIKNSGLSRHFTFIVSCIVVLFLESLSFIFGFILLCLVFFFCLVFLCLLVSKKSKTPKIFVVLLWFCEFVSGFSSSQWNLVSYYYSSHTSEGQ